MRALQAVIVRWLRAQLTPTERPPLLLRLLPRLPWRAQRLAARAWVQAELPDRRPAGGAAGGGAEGESPMMRVRTLEVMSPAECEAAVAEAEAWGAAN